MHPVLFLIGGNSMEVIIHLPRSKEGQEELAKRVATVHAQLIYNYISRLECSTEQKVALLDAIQENIHDEIKKEKEGWSLNLLHLDGFFDKVSATEDNLQLAARIDLNAFYHLTDDGVIVLHFAPLKEASPPAAQKLRRNSQR